MSTYSPGNPFAGGNPFVPTEDAPAAETVEQPVVEHVDEKGTETPEQILQRVRMLGADLQAAYRDADTLDETVEVLKAMKATYGVLYDVFTLARADMWETYGEGKHATETGRTFSFSKPTGSRSCNYDELAKGYPEAFAACVTQKAPKADAVGSLRLPKGDLK